MSTNQPSRGRRSSYRDRIYFHACGIERYGIAPCAGNSRAICSARVAASSASTSSNSSAKGVFGGSGRMYSRTSTKAPVAVEHPYTVRPGVSHRDQPSTGCSPGMRGGGLTGPYCVRATRKMLCPQLATIFNPVAAQMVESMTGPHQPLPQRGELAEYREAGGSGVVGVADECLRGAVDSRVVVVTDEFDGGCAVEARVGR
jgi:hypothetical protein